MIHLFIVRLSLTQFNYKWQRTMKSHYYFLPQESLLQFNNHTKPYHDFAMQCKHVTFVQLFRPS